MRPGFAIFAIAACLTLGMPLFSPAALAREIIDDTGRRVEIVDRPQRIVSLDDADLTVPLLELGVVPIASQGRLGRGGHHFLRSGMTLAGQDFDNTGMTFLGMQPVDVEAVAALKPDLILTFKGRPTPPEQLQAIAPTVVIDDIARGPDAIYDFLAELTGRQAALDLLKRRYNAQIAQLQLMAGDKPPVISVISATGDRKLSVERSYGSIGLVARDAGFATPELTKTIGENSGAVFSPEALPEFDADIVFDTYRNDRNETANDARQRLENMLPGYCRFLRACREGRYYFLPRDEAKSTTYAARMMAIALLTGLVSSLQLVDETSR
jgi:iron complex transport system substrate-binding protein